MKYYNFFVKNIAGILFFLMIFLIFPFSAFAVDEEDFLETIEKQEDSFETITEIEERREANVKHFLLPDGSYEAVVYGENVHVKDSNGKWQDIDNRLYDYKSHTYLSEDGRIAFNKKLNKNNQSIFSISDNGYKVSFSINDATIKNVNAKLSNHAQKYIPNENDSIDIQYNKVKSIDNETTICYKNIKSNTSFEYDIQSTNVKERIVLTGPCAEYVYRFTIEVDGLSATLNENNVVVLIDSESKEIVYTIPAPYMYDSTGAISYDINYTLHQTSDKTYDFCIVANDEWINSESRVFPVTIDPTLVQYAAIDTYIYSTKPASNYGIADELWISPYRTTYIKNSILVSNLPANVHVRSAKMYVAYYYYSSVTDGEVIAGAYQVNCNWYETSLTYNTAQQNPNFGYSTTCLSTAELSATVGATSSSPKWACFDITDAAISWYEGTSVNYGIALKYLGGTNSSVILKSFDSGTYNRPYMTVAYYTDEDQIIEDGVYWLSSKAAVGANGNARLMDVEGNSRELNAEIQQWASVDPSGDKYPAQLYNVKYVGEGYYRIYPFSNPNYCIRLNGDGITVGDENINPNYTKWSISGNSQDGYTICNWAGSSRSISVPTSISNGKALEFTSKYADNDNRNKWNFNKFEGFVLSIVTCGSEDDSGHAFLMFKNYSSQSKVLGYITIMPEDTVTIGTSFILEHTGIYYNREAYTMKNGDYADRVSLSIVVSLADIDKINTDYLLNASYDSWWPTTNCAYFAKIVWNSVCPNGAKVSASTPTPLELKESISEIAWHTKNIEIPKVKWYGYVTKPLVGDKTFVYVAKTGDAFPTIKWEVEETE